ncbi:MAG: carboxypeptidase regulatory-like domain-containing protein, partial [Candidatus Omnitrophica bacterium]|nr:carboxypeptidase regulatory-like domain-containing protein [Candidatus Omnitrophota bacterium]
MERKMRKLGMLCAILSVFVLFAGQCFAITPGVGGRAFTFPLTDGDQIGDTIVQSTPVLTPVSNFLRYVNVRFNETYFDCDTDNSGYYYNNFDSYLEGSQYILKVEDGGILLEENAAENSPYVKTYTIPSLTSLKENYQVYDHHVFVVQEDVLAALYAEIGETPQADKGTLIVFTPNENYEEASAEAGALQAGEYIFGAQAIVNDMDGEPATGIVRYIALAEYDSFGNPSAAEVDGLGIELLTAPDEDTFGFIVFNLDPGAVIISAQKDSYEFNWRPAFIYAGCMTSGISHQDGIMGMEILPLATSDVSGILVNEKGVPVSGATVELCGMQDVVEPQTTGSDGSFTLTGVPEFEGAVARASKSGYKDTYMLVEGGIEETTQNGDENITFVIVSGSFADGLESPELNFSDIDEDKGILLGMVTDDMGSPLKWASVRGWKEYGPYISAYYIDCMGEEIESDLSNTSDSGLFCFLDNVEIDANEGLEPSEPLYLDFAAIGEYGPYYHSWNYLGFLFPDGVTLLPMEMPFLIGHIEVTQGDTLIPDPVSNPGPGEVDLMHLKLDVTGLPEEELESFQVWEGYIQFLTIAIEGTGSLADVDEFRLYYYEIDTWVEITNLVAEVDGYFRTVFFRPEVESFFAQFQGGVELMVRAYFSEAATGTYRAVWNRNCDLVVNTINPISAEVGAQRSPFVPVSVSGAPIPAAEDAEPDLVRGGTACFIATAAFGSPFERHVQMLREFRDRYLLTNSAGRAFVRWYYKHSPKYAAAIARNEGLRAAARISLMPVYGIAFLLMKGLIPYLTLGLALFLLGAGRKMAKTTIVLLAAALLFGVSSTGFAADTNHFKVAPGESYTV